MSLTRMGAIALVTLLAGAAIAAAALGDTSPEVRTIAVLLGGTLALSSHGTKAATRLIINHSPEPFTSV